MILFLALFIIPSVALASWWNPFTWFNNWNFHKVETTSIKQESVKNNEEKESKKEDEGQNITSNKKESSNTTLDKKSISVKQEGDRNLPINDLEGARISTNKLNYIKGENIVVNIELPEDKFSSCQFALIDPNGNNIAMGEGGCVAGIRTDFDERYMQEPSDNYVPKGEVMSFISSSVSNGIEYGKLADNFGIWKLWVMAEKQSGSKHLLETKFDYEKNSSMFKQVVLNAPTIQKKITREELVKFDGSNGMFTAQSYGLNSINVYVFPRGGGIEQRYILGSMKLRGKDTDGLQTWTLSAYTKIGNDAPIKLGTFAEGTSIYADGFAGYGEDKHEVGKIYYPYYEKEDIYKYLY